MCAPEHISLVIPVPWPPEQISHSIALASVIIVCVSTVNCCIICMKHREIKTSVTKVQLSKLRGFNRYKLEDSIGIN